MRAADREPRFARFCERFAGLELLTVRHKVATPVNWRQGEDAIIAGPVSDEEAKKTYPEGWRAPRPYIRIVPAP